MLKSKFLALFLCLTTTLFVVAVSSCKKQPFNEKEVQWNSEINLEGEIEVYCDGELTYKDSLPATDYFGELTFYKDGTGKNESIIIIEKPTFTWEINGDTLKISSPYPIMKSTFIYVDTADPTIKYYKAHQFIGKGTPCWQDYIGPNNYLKLKL